MLKRWKKMIKNEKGFTLVELLAVIVILGIILAIAVPAVGKIIGNTESKAKEADCELVSNAAKLASLDGVDPKTVNELIPNYLESLPESMEGTATFTQEGSKYIVSTCKE